MFATADGTRLHVTEHGPAEAPVTVVLVHGWTLDERTWSPVVRRLAADGTVRVVTYDHRGHGRSDPARPGTATISQLADDLAELLDSRIGGPVVLAGHSMGGMAIMALAEQRPRLVTDRVVGAAFIATSCGDLVPLDLRLRPALARLVSGCEAWLVRRGSTSERLRARTVTARRASWIRAGVRWLLLGDHPHREDVEMTARCIAQCRPGSILDFRPTFDDHDRRAALAAFARIPTVVLGGVLDRLTPLRHTRAIADELPDARLVTYAGAGHMVPLERAEQVAVRIGELATVGADERRDPHPHSRGE